MLSDAQISTSGGIATPAATAEALNAGVRDREPTEDDWTNM